MPAYDDVDLFEPMVRLSHGLSRGIENGLTVDGKVQFACVDGPDFDGHKVDFDEAIARSATYKEQECASDTCNLTKEVK